MEKVNSWCMYKSVYFNQYSISKYQLKMDLFFFLIDKNILYIISKVLRAIRRKS